jgi:isopentenyldiphosphate isomerase
MQRITKSERPDLEEDKAITTRDWLLASVLKFCERYSGWSGFAGGLFLGLVVNALSDPGIPDLNGLVNRLFNVVSRPLNWLSWVAIGVMLLLSLVRRLLRWYSRRQSYEIKLARLYRNQVHESLRPFQRGHVAWGLSLTLQSSPDLRDGWRVEMVHVRHDITQYALPGNLDKLYRQYIDEEFHVKFSDDKTRFMLTQNPVSFSDLPTLRLSIQQTKWSQLRFYQDRVLSNSATRAKHIEQALDGCIDFPNSLSLLLVIATSDGYILLTQTGHKVHYYPNHWACSIGEHLDMGDLKGAKGPERPENVVINWVERALWEELGVTREGFDTDNVRIMAVIMESQIVNFSLVGIVTLNHDRSNLDAIIDKHPRTDYEFQEWDFIPWNDIPQELIIPTKDYHPSTGLRMFYAGLFRFGAPGLARRLMSCAAPIGMPAKR